MIRNLTIIVFVSSLLAGLAAGQDSQSSKKFYIACWSDWDKEPLYTENLAKGKSPKNMIKVGIHIMSYSAPYSYISGKPINLYKKTDNPDAPYQIVKSIVIPEQIKLPLVMMVKGKTRWLYLIYDIHPTVFPYGSYKMVNYTAKDIYVKMGENKVGIRPKQARSVVIPTESTGKALHCQSWHKEKEELVKVYSNMFMNRPEKRLLLFFYSTVDTLGQTVIKTRSLVDFKQN